MRSVSTSSPQNCTRAALSSARPIDPARTGSGALAGIGTSGSGTVDPVVAVRGRVGRRVVMSGLCEGRQFGLVTPAAGFAVGERALALVRRWRLIAQSRTAHTVKTRHVLHDSCFSAAPPDSVSTTVEAPHKIQVEQRADIEFTDKSS